MAGWIGWDIGKSGPQVTKIQTRLVGAFPSYAVLVHGVAVTGTYDEPTKNAVAEFQGRINASGRTPPLRTDGICDWATQVALGIVVAAAPPTLTTVFTVPGTWAGWNDGPPAFTAWKLDPKRFRQQGVGYPAMGFLQPDPNTSYNESRDAGTAEMLRLALPLPGPKVPIGYSQGADVVTRFLLAWPADRRNEIKAVITFGSPGRHPGPTALGNNPPGAGISGVYTPDWAADRTYDFIIDGDMYPCASGLLPILYDILTRMDLSLEFAKYLFDILTASVGAQLLGTRPASNMAGAAVLSGILGLVTPGPVTQTTGPVTLQAILFNIPAIISALATALKFVHTQAHSHYHDQPLFGGLTAVDKAAQIIQSRPADLLVNAR